MDTREMMISKVKKGREPYCFVQGWIRATDTLPKALLDELKFEIMKGLGLKNAQSWYRRLRGDVIPSVAEADMIREVFSRYGIGEGMVFGIPSDF